MFTNKEEINMIKILTLVSSEMIISEVSFEELDGYWELKYPAVMIPIPEQQNRLGFMKFLPFSNNGEKIGLHKDKIVTMSDPISGLRKSYENWATQVKAADAGLVTATSMPENTINHPGNN